MQTLRSLQRRDACWTAARTQTKCERGCNDAFTWTNTYRSTNLNALQSPLLSLPPELRTTIWELVLGEEILHVCSDPRKVPNSMRRSGDSYHIGVYVCTAKINDHHALATLRHGPETMDSGVKTYEDRHMACMPPPRYGCPHEKSVRHYSVALLQTCRQVHSEAALLPFDVNNFSFSGHDKLKTAHDFSARLMTSQQESIRSMTLGPTLWTSRPAPIGKPLQNLPALQSVTIFQEASHTHGAGASREASEPIVDMLKLMKLRRAAVCFYGLWHDHGLPPVSKKLTLTAKTALCTSLGEEMESRIVDFKDTDAAKASCGSL